MKITIEIPTEIPLANTLQTLIDDIQYALSGNRATYNRLAAKLPLGLDDPDVKDYFKVTDYNFQYALNDLKVLKKSILGELYEPYVHQGQLEA